MESSEPIPLGMKQIQEQLEKLNGWEIEEGRLVKEFNFQDFKTAGEFVNKVSQLAEEQKHHPDIFWWYNKIKLQLFTHRINSLTMDDFILAEKINKI